MVGRLEGLQPSCDHEGVANMQKTEQKVRKNMFMVTRTIKLMALETVLPLELVCGILNVLFFFFCHVACRTLVPQGGTESGP